MMKRLSILFTIVLAFNSNMQAQDCSPDAIHCESGLKKIEKAVATVVFRYNPPGIGALVQTYTTGVLLNNQNENGKNYFLMLTRSLQNCLNLTNPPEIGTEFDNREIKFRWNEGYVDCSKNEPVGSGLLVTEGATLVAIDGEFALLELTQDPPFASRSYLGWSMQSSSYPKKGDFCISHYEEQNNGYFYKSVLEMNQDISAEGVVDNCDEPSNYSIGGGEVRLKVPEWTKGRPSWRVSWGSPLLDSDNLVRGLYYTGEELDDIHEDSEGEDSCGLVGPSYFISLRNLNYDGPIKSLLAPNDINSETLRGIAIEPCKEEEIEDIPIDFAQTVEAIVITGRSRIDNVQVIFRAEDEVILEDGFNSGNEFIAEIAPCESTIVPLPKSRVVFDNEPAKETLNEMPLVNKETLNIIAYPTIIVDDRVTLESTNIERVKYTLVDLRGKVLFSNEYKASENRNKQNIDLPNLSKGTYILHLSNGKISKTVKLIRQ